jgi:N-[(2S)-2-amino-2-carboxyethyl]-L-glutamate dehydrogenase
MLATTASTPYLLDPALLTNSPIVLHLSLRDLGPNLISVSQNITDDPEHSFREDTSLHVAERTQSISRAGFWLPADPHTL